MAQIEDYLVYWELQDFPSGETPELAFAKMKQLWAVVFFELGTLTTLLKLEVVPGEFANELIKIVQDPAIDKLFRAWSLTPGKERSLDKSGQDGGGS